MCDRDGDGSISITEFRTVLRACLGEEPEESVCQRLFSQLDRDHSGTVELNEFLDVMSEWFGGDEWEKRRKGASSVAEERIGAHQSIKAFFSQFNEGSDNFGAARQRLKERLFARSMTMNDIEDQDDSLMTGSKQESDDQAKLAALNYANDCVLNFASVMSGLQSQNPYQNLEATKAVCELLSLVVLFNTPLERRSITTVLVKVFHLLYDGGVMNRVMAFLSMSQQPPLQFQALKALTLYIPGPRIASTPTNHDLHPDRMFFKRHVKNMNCIPVVYALLDHASSDIREQAVACLGAFVAQHPAARDYLLQNNGLAPLLRFAQPTQPVSMLRKVSFVLACFVGYTHPPGFQPDFGLVRPALPYIANLTYSNDEGVLRNTLAAMALVLPVVPENNMLARVLDVLTWQDDSQTQSVLAALHVVSEVIKMDHSQTKTLIEQNVMQRFKNLLRHRHDAVRLATVDTLTVLAQKGQSQALYDSKIIPMLLDLLTTDAVVRAKCARLFRIISNGTQQQASYLVLACDIIKRLCDSLVHFKEYDTVLAKIYRYMGPTYNFGFVGDVITALHNVVNVGFMIGEQTGDNNAYALRFTMGDLDQIKNLLNLMVTNTDEEKAWRKAAEAGGAVSAQRVEELIAALLFKVKKANDRAASSQSRVISQEITAIWDRFFGKSTRATASSEASVFFKCVMQGEASGHDIRIVEVAKDITFEKLLDKLQSKYHRRLVLQFKDADGDQVVLDSEGALKRALLSARNNTVILFLEDQGDLMTQAGRDPRLAASASGGPSIELSPTSSPQHKRRPPALAQLNTHGGSATLDFQQSPRKNLSEASGQTVVHAAPSSVPSSPSAQNWMAGIEQLSTMDRARHLEQVKSQVGLSQEQVEKLKQTFLKLSDGEGHVNRYKFIEGLKSIGITNDLLIEQNWNAFDDDRDGKVSIQEFLAAIGIMANGTMQV